MRRALSNKHNIFPTIARLRILSSKLMLLYNKILFNNKMRNAFNSPIKKRKRIAFASDAKVKFLNLFTNKLNNNKLSSILRSRITNDHLALGRKVKNIFIGPTRDQELYSASKLSVAEAKRNLNVLKKVSNRK